MLQTSFIVLTLISLVLLFRATSGNMRILLLYLPWLLLVGIPAYYGYFEETHTIPPQFTLIFAGIILITVHLYRYLRQTKLNLRYALLIHSLRIPVEWSLDRWCQEGLVPELMTHRGWNFDILLGFSALTLWISGSFLKVKWGNSLFMIWNIAGMISLCCILTLAILSSPLPLQCLAFDQPNIAVLKFPYIFLPACIVPIVFLTHLLTISQLRRKSHQHPAYKS